MSVTEMVTDWFLATSFSGPLDEALRKHNNALLNPRTGYERALVNILRGLAEYDHEYEVNAYMRINNDPVLYPVFKDLCLNVIRLLDGEVGNLDIAKLDYGLRELGCLHGEVP